MYVRCGFKGITAGCGEDTVVARTAQEDGKVFEEWVQDILTDLQENHRAMYHRFYDTHSAGGFLPAQPGDFLVLKGGFPLLIECKSSRKDPTLTRRYLSDSFGDAQCGKMRIWLRAGAGGIFLFRSDPAQTIEVWPAEYTINTKNIARKSPDIEEVFSVLPINKLSLKTEILKILENKLCRTLK